MSLSSVNLNFTDNQAHDGSFLFGGHIEICHVDTKTIGTTTGYKLLQRLSRNTFKIEQEYASIPAMKIVHCKHNNYMFPINNMIHLDVQRGQLFNLSVVAIGEFSLPVKERVAFTLQSRDKYSTQIYNLHYNYIEVKGCRDLGFKLFSERENELLILHPPGCIHSSARLVVNINLLKCPQGFVHVQASCECDETLSEITGHNDLCDVETGLIKSPRNNWMKPLLNTNLNYTGFMWCPNCPFSLCKKSNDNWLNFSSPNVDIQCRDNRTGIVCGACKQNYSLILNSLKCAKCNNNKYTSLILVFILAGIVMIVILTVLNITVAAGTINGLILYANLVNICWNLFFPPEIVEVNLLTIFIAWMNLDLGISTCFYNGLDSYSYTWLQFVFPFYLWFLTGAIILVSKFSTRVMKLLGSNPVAMFTTIFLMSYTKLLHTSQGTLSYVIITYSHGVTEYRWKFDPNIKYFEGKHIPLAVFAISVIAILLVPYILLLSFGYILQACSGKKGFRWFNQLMPILDAYYAPYSKNARFWTGYLLIVRTCLCIVSTVTSNNESILILIVIPSILSFTALIAWLKITVYEKLYINILEASFILNIIILASATYHIKHMKKTQLFVTYISTGIAFVEFLGIILFHIYLQLHKKIFWKNNSISRVNIAVKYKTKNITNDKGTNVSSTLVDIREPLLEDSNTKF